MLVNGTHYRTVWLEGGSVKMIEQRRLPHHFEIVALEDHRQTCEAIRTMVVRGAGAIGAAAGYAMAQAALRAPDRGFQAALEQAAAEIRGTRPTAHDLFYAVERVRDAALAAPSAEAGRQAAVQTAERLADENAEAGRRIGEAGLSLLRDGIRLLTHCNAGWLAFVDWGSALAPVYAAQQRGWSVFVHATETRPRSQGAKLTAWELGQAGVPHALIADTAAGWLFGRGEVDAVIVGADRIAANGDVANKIGTFTLAVLARHHGVPFYVAAPRSTFDPMTLDGAAIPIEQRAEEEVHEVWGLTSAGEPGRVRITPPGSRARNPAFDVTPAALVTTFLTEVGTVAPTSAAIRRMLAEAMIAAPSTASCGSASPSRAPH